MIALKLEVPELRCVHEVVCCCPHLVSLLCALTLEELFTTMKPAERIGRTIVGWKVELVEAWDTGAGAMNRVLVLVTEGGGNRCEVGQRGIGGLCL